MDARACSTCTLASSLPAVTQNFPAQSSAHLPAPLHHAASGLDIELDQSDQLDTLVADQGPTKEALVPY